jgi:FixJ family two-component response regulator
VNFEYTEHTVCVLDDEPHLVRSLSRLLTSAGFRVNGFDSAESFLSHAELEHPCCVVLDMCFPDLSGLQIQAEMLELGIECPVIFLSGHADIPLSVEAMKAGAIDFFTKPVDAETLIDAVKAAIQQHALGLAERDESASLRDRWSSLTPREQEVFQLVVTGRMNKEIAAQLGTVEKTIKVHRGRVMRKMNARRVTDLVRIADKLHELAPRESSYC